MNSINAGRPYIPNIMKDLRELESIQTVDIHRQSGDQKIGVFNALAVDDVTYTYPNSNRPSIRNFSLVAKTG